jgi:hypothetical protein
VDVVAGAFGEGRFVGRLDAGLAQGNGVPQDLDAKTLGRLREKNRITGNRLDDLDDPLVPFAATHALHRVAHRLRGDGRAVFRCRADRPGDQIAAHQRSRGVVDQHHFGARVKDPECIGDRILPSRSANDYPEAPAVVRLNRRSRRELPRERDNHLVYVRVTAERRDAALQDRSPAEVEQLLRHAGAKPEAGAAGSDDGSDVHVP